MRVREEVSIALQARNLAKLATAAVGVTCQPLTTPRACHPVATRAHFRVIAIYCVHELARCRITTWDKPVTRLRRTRRDQHGYQQGYRHQHCGTAPSSCPPACTAPCRHRARALNRDGRITQGGQRQRMDGSDGKHKNGRGPEVDTSSDSHRFVDGLDHPSENPWHQFGTKGGSGERCFAST